MQKFYVLKGRLGLRNKIIGNRGKCDVVQPSLRDSFVCIGDPALKRRAIFVCACGAEKNLRESADAFRVQSVAEKLFWTFRNGVKFLRFIKIC
jgi:hypothetical protein